MLGVQGALAAGLPVTVAFEEQQVPGYFAAIDTHNRLQQAWPSNPRSTTLRPEHVQCSLMRVASIPSSAKPMSKQGPDMAASLVSQALCMTSSRLHCKH